MTIQSTDHSYSSERLAYFGVMGAQLRGSLELLEPVQHCGFEGFKGTLNYTDINPTLRQRAYFFAVWPLTDSTEYFFGTAIQYVCKLFIYGGRI